MSSINYFNDTFLSFYHNKVIFKFKLDYKLYTLMDSAGGFE